MKESYNHGQWLLLCVVVKKKREEDKVLLGLTGVSDF